MKGTPPTVNISPLSLTLCIYHKMPGPYKGFSSQCTTQQEHSKPRHQPSDIKRDQRARERLKNKAFQAKIKS